MQPVHSWKCSQTTDGFFLPTLSAIFSPAQAGRPTAAAATLQTLMKSRRETRARHALGDRPGAGVFHSILRMEPSLSPADWNCNPAKFRRLFPH